MQARIERSSLTERLAAASVELARYKDATGHSLESLEAERSNAAALALRSKARVPPYLLAVSIALGDGCRCGECYVTWLKP